MKLPVFITPTAIAHPGMTVLDVFRECVKADVPGIPFQDGKGNITGKASIRHVLKETYPGLHGEAFTPAGGPDTSSQYTG